MISAILIAIAAILNAVMDKLENENYYTSIFRNWNERFWYKRTSWKYAKKTFGWKLDGWHVAKSLMIILLCAAVAFHKSVFPWWAELLIAGAIWNLVFNLFYNKILKK